MKTDTVEEQLLWLLRTLCDDGHALFLASMPLVMDELDRLLQSEPRARELVSPYIAGMIGDLSIISQCLNQLSHYQPWARTWVYELVSREDNIKQDYARRTGSWSGILTAIRVALSETNKSAPAAGLGEPSGGKFTYPINKRRTKENVEALRRAEGHLDVFWAAIDQVMVSRAGNLHGTAARNVLSQGRILQRTPEWVDTQKPQAPSAQDKVVGEADPYAYLPISTVYSGLSAKELDIAQPKTKVKTHGTPQAPAHSTEAEALLHPNQADPQPTFSVDARALKVFRTAFFNPSATALPGEVAWNDFLHAMTSVGFTAMKLYGSVWQFQPTKLDVERSIQFHEPHPRGKLPFTTARRYGRRLNRAYGWFGGMFVLNKK